MLPDHTAVVVVQHHRPRRSPAASPRACGRESAAGRRLLAGIRASASVPMRTRLSQPRRSAAPDRPPPPADPPPAPPPPWPARQRPIIRVRFSTSHLPSQPVADAPHREKPLLDARGQARFSPASGGYARSGCSRTRNSPAPQTASQTASPGYDVPAVIGQRCSRARSVAVRASVVPSARRTAASCKLTVQSPASAPGCGAARCGRRAARCCTRRKAAPSSNGLVR